MIKGQSLLFYDTEIVNCIPPKDGEPLFGFTSCKGWHDFGNMGISVLVAYDALLDVYRVFMEDNIHLFEKLVNEREHVIGFNSRAFDDVLCQANGIEVTTTYDLLCEIRVASGQSAQYIKGVTRSGYRLEDLAKANLGYGKSGSGELAPKLWQLGSIGAVADYALMDVAITVKLFDLAQRGELRDPVDGTVLGNIRRV